MLSLPAPAPRARPGRALLVVALVAAALRLAYVVEVHERPDYDVPLVDAADYHARAQRVASGEGLGPQVHYKAPAYAWLVGQLYRLVGPRLEVAYALQMLAGIAGTVLVTALGMRWLGARAGILGGLLGGLYAPLPYFENQLLIESSALFVSIAAVALLVRGVTWADVAAGVAAGAAVQLRPINVAFVAALLVWIATGSEPAARKLRRAACVLGPVLLLLVPTARHNRIATGRFVPISVNGGINFFIGNNPDYDATVAIRPGLRWEELTARFGATDDPVRWQQNFYREAFAYMRAEPLAYVRLLGRKLLRFWHAAEIDRNQDAQLFGPSRVLGTAGVPWSVVAILGLVGLARLPRATPVRALVLLQMLGVVVFFVTSRYRLVVVPWLALAAGLAVEGLLAAVAARRAARVGVTILGLGLAALLVLPDWTGAGRLEFGRPDFDRAEVLGRRGDRVGALGAYQRAAARHPDDPDAHFRYGEQLERFGRRQAALASYLRAAELAPWSYKPMLAAGIVCILEGDLERAWDTLVEAERRGDAHGRSLYNLGVVRERQGRDAEALALYRRSLVRRDDEPEVLRRRLGAARMLLLLGRHEEAEVEFAAAAHAARDPLHVPLERAEAWLRAGSGEEALAALAGLTGLETSARGQHLLSRALSQAGDAAAALHAARRSVELDSTVARHRDWLARLQAP